MGIEIILNIKAYELFRPLNQAMQFGIDTEDMLVISTLKACCTSIMLHAQEDRVLSRVTDMILGELQKVEEMSNGEAMERVKDA